MPVSTTTSTFSVPVEPPSSVNVLVPFSVADCPGASNALSGVGSGPVESLEPHAASVSPAATVRVVRTRAARRWIMVIECPLVVHAARGHTPSTP